MSTGFQIDTDDEVMSEINMTPLVDVMLVLLIIFMITIPVMRNSVNVNLPTENTQPQLTLPQTIRLAVAANGEYYWNDQLITAADLPTLMRNQAQQAQQPELHIWSDKAARYEWVAKVLAEAQRSGLSKIGFVTDSDNAALP